MIYGMFNSTWLSLGGCMERWCNIFRFCHSWRRAYFCQITCSVLYSRHLCFSHVYFFCNSKMISTWLLWPMSLTGCHFHVFWGQRATISCTARAQQGLTSHLLSWNGSIDWGWSLRRCQSNEGQQLWWQISFDKLNDPPKRKVCGSDSNWGIIGKLSQMGFSMASQLHRSAEGWKLPLLL